MEHPCIASLPLDRTALFLFPSAEQLTGDVKGDEQTNGHGKGRQRHLNDAPRHGPQAAQQGLLVSSRGKKGGEGLFMTMMTTMMMMMISDNDK